MTVNKEATLREAMGILRIDHCQEKPRVPCFGDSCQSALLPVPSNLGPLLDFESQHGAETVVYEVPQ